MESAITRDPFSLLRDIEARSRKHAVGMPQQVRAQQMWSGIGFRIGESRLLTPVGDVSEMIRPPEQLTRVPGVRPWVRGVANIRGSLLPIIDLTGWLGGEMRNPGKRSRVLIINRDELTAGLLVDEVVGLRQFFAEERSDDVTALAPMVQPAAHGCYQRNDEVWGVITVDDLVSRDNFMQAAI